MVTDPPPMELTRQGQTYYLAHFNARRAIYSPSPRQQNRRQRAAVTNRERLGKRKRPAGYPVR